MRRIVQSRKISPGGTFDVSKPIWPPNDIHKPQMEISLGFSQKYPSERGVGDLGLIYWAEVGIGKGLWCTSTVGEGRDNARN